MIVATGGVALYLKNREPQDDLAIVPKETTLPTGQNLKPLQSGYEVGGFPCNLAATTSGKFIVSTTAGQNQTLSVLSTQTGQLFSRFRLPEKTHLYFGLVAEDRPDGGLTVWASMSRDRIQRFEVSANGETTLSPEIVEVPKPAEENRTQNPAGLARLGNGSFLVALNQSWRTKGHKGYVAWLRAGEPAKYFETGGYPLDLAVLPTKEGFSKGFASCERDNLVTVFDPNGATRKISVGTQPTRLLLSKDRRRLFVANSNSDTITVINTRTEKVEQTILVRPSELRGLPGCTPLGMVEAEKSNKLFVALADINAIAVLDLRTSKLLGYFPTGWYPTAVSLTPDEKSIYIANAKGNQAKNPNHELKRDRYVLSKIRGSVQILPLDRTLEKLASHSQSVVYNSGIVRMAQTFYNPGIKHVIYVIKENRTYDQVFGDIPIGNGQKDLCLFPEAVTPNQHALAKRFGLLDNFYVCGEVSQDGWAWSTGAMANEFVQRNTVAGYSGGSRTYDSEGENNGTVPDMVGLRDTSEGPGGTLWAAAIKKGLKVRNYGVFVASQNSEDENEKHEPLVKENEPTQRILQGITCPNFRQYDTSFCDSQAFEHADLPPTPKQLLNYGEPPVASRFAAFKAEFDKYVLQGELPDLIVMRFPRDHTAGTSIGLHSPQAMVADNDYAVGQLVDLVSHSPFWKDTAIFVLEDDAQAGFDHVDCHRSIALVISPYTESTGTANSRFYNTDSFLRTIESILKLDPLTHYDATAPLFNNFTTEPVNAEPFNAILPSKDILGQVNGQSAYRAKDSQRILGRFEETNIGDAELNDILWGSIKGATVPRPNTPGSIYSKDALSGKAPR